MLKAYAQVRLCLLMVFCKYATKMGTGQFKLRTLVVALFISTSFDSATPVLLDV